MPPEKPIVITIIKPSDIEVSISDPASCKRPIADPPPRYTCQRPETPAEPGEEPWDDLSIDYGFIGVERERGHDGGEDEHQQCRAGDSYQEKDARQAKSFLSQKSTHACSQAHMPTHTQTEMSTLTRAHAFSWGNSVLPTQTWASLLPFQGAANGAADAEFPPTNPQIGKIDGGMEGGSDSERVSLLSAYASQNVKDMPTSRAEQSDVALLYLPDDFGVLRLATAHDVEEDEEEEGTSCINWDPETRKLVLPQMVMEVNKKGGMMLGEKGRENGMGGEEEEEEVYVMKSELRLENVYVRQGSEEEAEAQREAERGRDTALEPDDILTKWNLVISMDQ